MTEGQHLAQLEQFQLLAARLSALEEAIASLTEAVLQILTPNQPEPH